MSLNAIVVGAGVAGLSAARTLKENGCSVRIFEARDRIGGRVWTDHTLGVPIDMGAHWIHGTEGNPIAELAREMGIRTVATDFENSLLFDQGGSLIDDDRTWEIEERFEDLLSLAMESTEVGDDRSVRDGLASAMRTSNLDPHLFWFRANRMAQICACDLDDLSLRYARDDQPLEGDNLLFPHGYEAIPRALAADLDIHLEHPVDRIVHTANGVTVYVGTRTYVADAAIVTIPLGLLKGGRIVFDPPLPEASLQAIKRLGMGVLNRLVMRFPRVFWPADKDLFGYVASCIGSFTGFFNLSPTAGAPVLLAFVPGGRARALERLTAEGAAAEAMQVLRQIFGGEAVDPDGVLLSHWAADPWSLGSYSYLPVGASGADYDRLSEPIGPRLLLAGEATHRQFPGTVHGAFLSGQREARRLLELL